MFLSSSKRFELFQALAGEHQYLVAGILDADKAMLGAPGTAGHAQRPGAFARLAEELFDLLARHAGLELGKVFLGDRIAAGKDQQRCHLSEMTQRHRISPKAAAAVRVGGGPVRYPWSDRGRLDLSQRHQRPGCGRKPGMALGRSVREAGMVQLRSRKGWPLRRSQPCPGELW